MTIEPGPAVETFCVFFERGFVEDAWRSAASGDGALLDDPERLDLALGLRSGCGRAAVESMARCIACARRRRRCRRRSGILRSRSGTVELRTELAREIGRVQARAFPRDRNCMRACSAAGSDGRNADRKSAAQTNRKAGSSFAVPLPPGVLRGIRRDAARLPDAQKARKSVASAEETDSPITDVCLDTGLRASGVSRHCSGAGMGRVPRSFGGNMTDEALQPLRAGRTVTETRHSRVPPSRTVITPGVSRGID